jgi:glycosyltransferase involved in cell wall biosynthesis
MYRDKKVSVVLPTYNERDSIRSVIEAFEATGVVDEIIVINNNAQAGTSAEVAPTSAIEVHEPRQGYGSAILRGFKESTGHLVCVCEPDGTFDAEDIHKLLAYSHDVDIVYGSRTVGEFIWAGANMGFLLRLGNWAVAKLMEVLFNTNSLSDIGCTMRLARKEALDLLEPHFSVAGSYFGPEMMCLSVIADLRIVQIPVNYRVRVGQSSVTGNLYVAVKLGLRMIALILDHRLRSRAIRARISSTRRPSAG